MKTNEGGRPSNGRHTLREAYAGKREWQLGGVEARLIERSLRTPEEQLARLDYRFGVGIGAKKERARLKLEMLTFVGGEIVTSMKGNRAAKELAIAKMESQGYRIMRRLGLTERELLKFGCTHAGV